MMPATWAPAVPTLTTDTITLQPLRASDATLLERHFVSQKVLSCFSEAFTWPYPGNVTGQYIYRILDDRCGKQIYAWSIRLSSDTVGVVAYEFFLNGSNLSFWLGEDFWGQGLMSAAIAVTLDHVLLTCCKLRIAMRSYTDNEASRRIICRHGGRWLRDGEADVPLERRAIKTWEISQQRWRAARITARVPRIP